MVEKPLDGHSLSDLESKTLVELQAMAKSMEIRASRAPGSAISSR